MNIEFDPEQMNFPKEPKRHVMRPYLLLGAYLLFLALLLLIPGLMPSGANPGTGSGFAGTGTGSGISGSGSGAGGKSGGTGSSATIPANGPGAGVETGPEPSTAESSITGNSEQEAGVAGGQAASAEIALSPRPVRWDNPEPQKPAAASRQAGAQGVSGQSGQKGFYGIEVKPASKIIFLVDTSGSMSADTPEGRTRLETLKAELQKSVEQLYIRAKINPKSSTGTYRVTAFAEGTTDFPGGPAIRVSDISRLQELKQFLSRMYAGGGTNMLTAWQHLIGLLAKEEIDTIYFLSDGDPTDCSEQNLLDYLKSNLPKTVTVHTISIGQTSDLLRRLAEQHRGIYTEKY
ncbi:MAG: VWA domain-containing protein [Lentisphaeria bacterium]|nr:VWA domain-containing protein [Lentisphaeria bacterium]